MSHAGSARRSTSVIAAIAVCVVAFDQITKSLVLEHLRDRIVPIVGPLQLNLELNPGGAFGIGRGYTPFFVVAGLVLLVVLVLAARQSTGRLLATAFGLVLGGAVGNLVDRIVRDHGGAVVDFIDVQFWPVFNVADMAITGGALLLAVLTLRGDGAETREA